MLVDRHLDGGVQLPLLERLDQIAKGQYFAGATQQVRVGIRAQEDHRHVEALTQALCRLDAAERAGEPHVHQHDIRNSFRDRIQRLFAPGCQAAYRVSEGTEPVLYFHGDQRFILYDEDSRLRRPVH